MNMSEFKQYLKGVMDMQSDDWTPNRAQFDKIVSMINAVECDTQSNDSTIDEVLAQIKQLQSHVAILTTQLADVVNRPPQPMPTYPQTTITSNANAPTFIDPLSNLNVTPAPVMRPTIIRPDSSADPGAEFV